MLRDQSLNCRQPYDGFIKAVLVSRSTKARRETSFPALDQDSTSAATMAATFRTRPCLLAPSRPVVLQTFLCGPRVHQANLEQTRGRSYKPDAAYRQGMGSARRQRSQQQATSSIIKEMHGADKLQDTGSIAMLSPSKHLRRTMV